MDLDADRQGHYVTIATIIMGGTHADGTAPGFCVEEALDRAMTGVLAQRL